MATTTSTFILRHERPSGQKVEYGLTAIQPPSLSISGGALTLGKYAYATIKVTTATYTAGSTDLTVADANNIAIGMEVVGGSIPNPSIVTAINGVTIKINQQTSGGVTGGTVTFRPFK